jgi:hypothetical protein
MHSLEQARLPLDNHRGRRGFLAPQFLLPNSHIEQARARQSDFLKSAKINWRD